MNRRQLFALATTPALGVPALPIEARPDWRTGFLKLKLNMFREIVATPGDHEPQRIIINTCNSLLKRTDAQAEADRIRILAMINKGRAFRGLPPITEFDR